MMERIIPPLTFLLSKKSINIKPISANATFDWARFPKLKTFLLASATIIPAWRNPIHEINKPIPAPRAIFYAGWDNFYYKISHSKEAHGHKNQTAVYLYFQINIVNEPGFPDIYRGSKKHFTLYYGKIGQVIAVNNLYVVHPNAWR